MKKVLVLVLLCACDSGSGCDGRHVATPAPEAEASATAEGPSPNEPEALPEGIEPPGETTSKPTKNPAKTPPPPNKKTGSSKGSGSSKSSGSAASAPGNSTAAKEPSPSPAPATPAPTPPKASVLPRTANVSFEVSSELHKLIDADGRMVGWLRRVLPVIDGCYRSSASGKSGTVKVALTMHENRRPSTAIQSLPGSLASLVPCATTKLMNQRPPLFTGPEGARYTVGIRFTP